MSPSTLTFSAHLIFPSDFLVVLSRALSFFSTTITFSGVTKDTFSASACAALFSAKYSSEVIVPLSISTFSKSVRASLEALTDNERVHKKAKPATTKNELLLLVRLTVISPCFNSIIFYVATSCFSRILFSQNCCSDQNNIIMFCDILMTLS